MFTGIVQGTATVAKIEDHLGLRRMVLTLPAGLDAGLQAGASVSVSGVCLTAVQPGPQTSFDCIAETLERTTLGSLVVGDRVNVERAATFGAEIGGHLLSGHVVATAEVVARDEPENNVVLTLRVPRDLLRFTLAKGYVALDGCSLTIGEVDEEAATFQVHLIPETLRLTTFDTAEPGRRINLEVDPMTQAVVETVERVLASRG